MTKEEVVIAGLLHETPNYLVEVVNVEGKGRGVVVKERVPMGAYVCEYEATTTYRRKERANDEAEYAKNDEGCFILDVLTKIDECKTKYLGLQTFLYVPPSPPLTCIPCLYQRPLSTPQSHQFSSVLPS